jgi:hypothetical protein
MKLVVIESPYGTNPDGSRADAATVERRIRYVRACMADCLARGEAPYASHALYTLPGVLDDATPEERRTGMVAGFAWGAVAGTRVVYADEGVTPGMREGIARAEQLGQRVEWRTLPGWAEVAA